MGGFGQHNDYDQKDIHNIEKETKPKQYTSSPYAMMDNLAVGTEAIISTTTGTESGTYGPQLKDGGTRKAGATGAEKEDKSTREGIGAYHLLPPHPIKRVAEIYRKGALKYAARNWEQGIALSNLLDSAKRHLDQFHEGMEDEDHLHQALWNLLAISHTMEMIERGVLSPTLNDLPSYGKNGVPVEVTPGNFCDKWREPGPGLDLPDEDKGKWLDGEEEKAG